MAEQELIKTYIEDDLYDAIRHGMCVSRLATAVAQEMELDEDTVSRIATAGMLHDIGKLRISRYIYGRTEDSMKIEEMKYLRQHARLGADIVTEQGYGDDIAEMIMYHHENYDGSGYPYRMMGDDIPLGSRIIRVCDVFVALISNRPYRKAFDPDTALVMVIDEVRHFDMKIFLAFQKMLNTTDIMDQLNDILHGEITGLED